MAYVSDSSLKVYLNANGYSGTTSVWSDLSGNGNDFTLNGFAFNSSSGWTGTSLKADGINDYVILDKAGVITNSGYSVELYIKKAFDNSWNAIFANSYDTNYRNGMYLFGKYSYTTANGAGGGDMVFNTLPNGTSFTHIVLSWDGETHTKYIYVNGIIDKTEIESDSGQYFTSQTTTKTTLFSNINGTADFCNGEIAIVRMYNRKLTDAEITQNYNDVMGIGGGTDVTVNSIVSTNTVTAISPIITTEFNVIVSSIVATSTAELIVPQISTGVSYTVNAPPTNNNLNINNPIIETIQNININSLVFSSSVNSNIPSVNITSIEDVNILTDVINSLVVVNNPTIQVAGNVNINPSLINSNVALNVPIVDTQRNIIINAALFNIVATQNIPTIYNNVYSQYLLLDLIIVNKQEFTSNITTKINFDLSL